MYKTIEKIQNLLDFLGVSAKKMTEELEISTSSMSEWKKGKGRPSSDTIVKISKYFGVSTDYLLTCDNEWYEDYYEDFQNANELHKMYLIEKWGLPSNYVDVALFYFKNKSVGSSVSESEIQSSQFITLSNNKLRAVPVFESVSAGFGVLAENNISEYMPLYIDNDDEAENTICIKIIGDSMYPKIEDGDIIQVHKQSNVDSGTVAVVLVGDEGFVKKVVYGENWIELHSFNPIYPTMRFENEDTLKLKIVGKVKKIIKTI